jgi:hypothetical protein
MSFDIFIYIYIYNNNDHTLRKALGPVPVGLGPIIGNHEARKKLD